MSKMGINFILINFLPLISANHMKAGIDVSHWERNIDWTKVSKQGIEFAFAKATEGSHYCDPTFVTNWNAIRSNGMIAGAYHFFRSDASVEDQINNIKTNIVKKVYINVTEETLLAIDFETNYGKLDSETLAHLLFSFIKRIESEFHIKPVIYTGPDFWKSSMKKMALKYPFNDYRLWIAYYTDKSPTIPEPWNQYFIWQFTNKGVIKGISGNVDMDWMNTTLY